MDLIDRAELKKKYPISSNDFGLVVNDDLHNILDSAQKVDAVPMSVIDEIKAKIDFEEKWLMDVWHTDEKTNRRMNIDDIRVAMDGLRHFINEKVKEYTS